MIALLLLAIGIGTLAVTLLATKFPLTIGDDEY
jgi:hypothetical protein